MSKKAYQIKNRFGTRPDNLGLNLAEVRPLSKCVRPSRPVKIEIRPGLVVYAAKGKSIAQIRKKYEGR